MILFSQTSQKIILNQIHVAKSSLQRALGLLGKTSLGAGEGMFFSNCRMIHTCCMLFKIDVIFMDDTGLVLKTAAELAPWKIAYCWQGKQCHTLETAAGLISSHAIQQGDRLLLKPTAH